MPSKTISKSKIPYLDYLVHPVSGCTPMDEACRNCWACRTMPRIRLALGRTAADGFRPMYHHDWYKRLELIRKPSVIGVGFYGDLFHDFIPSDARTDVIYQASKNPQHTFLLLTKRYERMAYHASDTADHYGALRNIWWGMSAWDEPSYHQAMREILNMPTGINIWLSIEPLIGPIPASALKHLNQVKQVIVGGESGVGARPMRLDWVRVIWDACAEADVPFYFKQFSSSAKPPMFDTMRFNSDGLPLLDGRTYDKLAWRKA